LSNLWKAGDSDRSSSGQYFTELELEILILSVFYTVVAAMDAWKDANLSIGITDEPDWDSGTIFEQEHPELIVSAKASIKLMIFKHVDWVVPQWLRQ
jgi:hypothetical protein